MEASELPGKPVSVAGLSSRDAALWCEGRPPELPTVGASALLFALAALADERSGGIVAAVDQATMAAGTWEPGTVTVQRDERPPLEEPTRRLTPGPDIKLSFAAYDRAFDAKLRWEAGSCPTCGTLAFPPRFRCLGCGEEGSATLVPLPRTGTVYTATTIHVPVPGLSSPYTLAVVQLDGVDVRALAPVTDTVRPTAEIDEPGRLVFRKMATRSGIPDYGYAFAPERRCVMRRVAIVGAGMTPFAEHFDLGIKELVPMAVTEMASSVDRGFDRSRHRGGMVRRAGHDRRIPVRASWPTVAGSSTSPSPEWRTRAPPVRTRCATRCSGSPRDMSTSPSSSGPTR